MAFTGCLDKKKSSPKVQMTEYTCRESKLVMVYIKVMVYVRRE